MKLRKTISKILALGTGAVMVGATILSATAAADMKDYPSPFIKDGKFNAVIVVGDSAATSDVIGSVDVATSLQFASRVQKTITSVGGGNVAISGEAWRVGSGAKKLEFSERLDAGTQSTHQESIRNITTFIGRDELPNLLAAGTFSNTQGDYDYKQYIYFDSNPAASSAGNPIMLSVAYAEDPDTSVASDYLFIDGQTGNSIARYSLEFTESAKSDITDSAGTVSATGTFLWNFEGKSIKMLGKDWSIVKARTDSTGHAEIELTLMGGATKDVLSEGESKSYTIGGKSYDVSLDFVGTTTAKFTVNGEVTDSLQEGSTQTLKDGTQLGIRDIIAQDFAGGVRKTEFFLGADKIILKDTAVGSAGIGSNTLTVGTDTVTGTTATIAATNTSSNSMTLTSIALNITASEDYYVLPGGKLSQQLADPGALLNSWDIEYGGLEPVATENIKLTPSGSTQYFLEFADSAGNNVKLPIAYTAGTSRLKMGDSNDDTVLLENQTITKNDYFVVTDSTQQQGQRKTYGLRYISSLASSESSPTIVFQDLGSAGKVTVDYKTVGTVPGTGTEAGTLKLGGGTFKIWNASSTASTNFDLKIDLDGDGALEGVASNGAAVGDAGRVINITTAAGANVGLLFHPVNYTANASNTATVDSGSDAGSIVFSMQTLDTDDFDNVVPSNVEFNISASAAKVDIAEHTVASNLLYLTPDVDTNLRQAYTALGAFVDWHTVSSDPDSLAIEYPATQRLPIVTVSGPGATISTTAPSEAGQIVYYETTPIAVGTAKLASEVSDITAQNAIVVGGPCVNAAAAALMGNPANCVESFTEGKAMLKLFENKGNVALLVAGYSAMDTRRASRVIGDFAKWQEQGVLKGTEVEVAGTSFTDITVSAPAPKVVAPVVVETPVVTETPATDDGTADQGTGDAPGTN